MSFSELFNNYIDNLNCTAKELAQLSNVDEAVISKYKNGERTPKINSATLLNIIDGLSILLKTDKKVIYQDFYNVLNKDSDNFDIFVDNLNSLIENLNINVANLAKYMGYDSSYISKIRRNERKPSQIDEFKDSIYTFIISNYKDEHSKNIISSLLNIKYEDIEDLDNYKTYLKNWMSIKNNGDNHYINEFFKLLNDFDINEYVNNKKVAVPNFAMPFTLPKTKTYFGNKLYEAELTFMKCTLLAKNKEYLYLYSTMPLDKDTNIYKKLSKALSLILKDNITINVIHNIDRPKHEIITGLTSWIPLYMTGNINSYYFNDNESKLYLHLEAVSNDYALTGEAITNHMNDAKFYLTNKKEEVNYSYIKMKNLIKKAKPLIKTYTSNDKEEFNEVINKMTTYKNDRHNYLSTLPIYTISDDLLNTILKRNNVNKKDVIKIKEFVQNKKEQINKILKNNKIYDYINNLDNNNFNRYLSLSELLLDYNIKYNIDEYNKHIKLTEEFKNKNNNYSYRFTDNIFNNIKITIIKDKLIVISKEKNPTIHFIIKHPKLRKTIENLEIKDSYTK